MVWWIDRHSGVIRESDSANFNRPERDAGGRLHGAKKNLSQWLADAPTAW
jgi:hypothetical protein